MKIAKYYGNNGKIIEVEYDEKTPCIICGEPVLSASMGGTLICPSCDCGRCRFCGSSIHCINPELDGGSSKQQILNHMKICREMHKDVNERLIKLYDLIEIDNKKFDEMRRCGG